MPRLPSVCACARVVRMDGDSEGDCPARRRAILCLEKHLGRRSCLEKHLGRRSCAVATTAGRPSLRHHFYASVCRRVCRRGEVRCSLGPWSTRHTTYTHANHVHHRLACQRVVHVGPCVPRRMEPEKCEEWAWKKWPAEIPQPRFLPLDTLLRARFLSLEWNKPAVAALSHLRSVSTHANSLWSLVDLHCPVCLRCNGEPHSSKQGFCPFAAVA